MYEINGLQYSNPRVLGATLAELKLKKNYAQSKLNEEKILTLENNCTRKVRNKNQTCQPYNNGNEKIIVII